MEMTVLPARVRTSDLPLPKSMVTLGTGRTVSQQATNFSLMVREISGSESNTALSVRAFVQQNSSSRRPKRWSKKIGLPSRAARACACWRVGSQSTPAIRTVFGAWENATPQAERSAKAPNVTAVHAFRRITRLLEVVELGIGRENAAPGYGFAATQCCPNPGVTRWSEGF
jgi:hypothetical protein